MNDSTASHLPADRHVSHYPLLNAALISSFHEDDGSTIWNPYHKSAIIQFARAFCDVDSSLVREWLLDSMNESNALNSSDVVSYRSVRYAAGIAPFLISVGRYVTADHSIRDFMISHVQSHFQLDIAFKRVVGSDIRRMLAMTLTDRLMDYDPVVIHLPLYDRGFYPGL